MFIADEHLVSCPGCYSVMSEFGVSIRAGPCVFASSVSQCTNVTHHLSAGWKGRWGIAALEGITFELIEYQKEKLAG